MVCTKRKAYWTTSGLCGGEWLSQQQRDSKYKMKKRESIRRGKGEVSDKKGRESRMTFTRKWGNTYKGIAVNLIKAVIGKRQTGRRNKNDS